VLYDYADSNITWSTTGGSFESSSITQDESWTYFVPQSMTMNTTTQLTRSSTFGSSKNFTLLFRFYVSSLSSPGMSGTTVVGNGTPGAPPSYFWAIFMNGAASGSQKFQVIWTSSGTQQAPFVIGPSTNIVADKWYHVAFKVVDNGSNNSFFGYIDGVQTATSPNISYIDAAVGATILGNLGTQAQAYQLAEFVFIEEALSNNLIAAYARSAYI
jgi:hypothetical protein